MSDNLAEKRGTQFFFDLVRLTTEALVATGIDAEQARKAALQVAEQARETYGGEQLYIPKGLALVVSERDREIWRKYNGSNHFALAKEYNLTVRQIYSIIERVRAEEFHRRQLGLW